MPALARRRKLHLATPILVGALLIPGPSSTAGTGVDPEITDVAGDANYINGQDVAAGLEHGPDTRPASFDNVDLVSVWFETPYETNRVLDSATGEVLRVEHEPTGLLIHWKTAGPILPMDPFTHVDYIVRTHVGDCELKLSIRVGSANPGSSIYPWSLGCDGWWGRNVDPPVIQGNIGTGTFLRKSPNPSKPSYFLPGVTLKGSFGLVQAHLPRAEQGFIYQDETKIGRDFTIGQDVPPDVECADEPTYPACEG